MQGHQLSAELNLAYQTLVDPVLRGQYDRRLGSFASSRSSFKRAPRDVPGLVGPILDGEVLLRNMMPSSNSVDKKATNKEGRRLVVWLREWARTFVFASDLPLPLPVQVSLLRILHFNGCCSVSFCCRISCPKYLAVLIHLIRAPE